MSTPNSTSAESSARSLAEGAADRASSAIESTRRAAEETLDAARSGIDNLREKIPAKVGEAVDSVNEYARAGADKARDTYSNVKDQVCNASESTKAYVREEPVKSLLIAGAAGALLAGAASWLARRRS